MPEAQGGAKALARLREIHMITVLINGVIQFFHWSSVIVSSSYTVKIQTDRGTKYVIGS